MYKFVSLSLLSCTALLADSAPELYSKEPVKEVAIATRSAPEAPFTPFTGRIKGRKVRMRHQPDLDGYIVKELNKNDLVTVVGKKGDFWAVEPPANTKAFVFRGLVLDNVVEGNRVNVRLEPSTDAPVIGHLNAGDRLLDSVISAINNKWLEITPPKSTHFYVAQDLIEFAGGPEVKEQFDRRFATAEQLLDATAMLSKAELKKPFEAIDLEKLTRGYHTVINDYAEFPEYVEQAKEALASLQEAYLQKRISHLESQAETESLARTAPMQLPSALPETLYEISAKMKYWEPVEESLYLSWTRLGENQTLQQYYEEQRLNATSITGVVDNYSPSIKNKPGDFVVKENGIPVAYVYSTTINLDSLVGKKVTLTASPRPNNNFAFPAYFVLSVE